MTPNAPSVRVFLDDSPVVVPARVDCHYAARGALGVARGLAVAYEHAPREPLAFDGGHRFGAGDRYVTLDVFSTIGALEIEVARPDEHREAWQTDPDAWKGGRGLPPI